MEEESIVKYKVSIAITVIMLMIISGCIANYYFIEDENGYSKYEVNKAIESANDYMVEIANSDSQNDQHESQIWEWQKIIYDVERSKRDAKKTPQREQYENLIFLCTDVEYTVTYITGETVTQNLPEYGLWLGKEKDSKKWEVIDFGY